MVHIENNDVMRKRQLESKNHKVLTQKIVFIVNVQLFTLEN